MPSSRVLDDEGRGEGIPDWLGNQWLLTLVAGQFLPPLLRAFESPLKLSLLLCLLQRVRTEFLVVGRSEERFFEWHLPTRLLSTYTQPLLW